MSWGVDFASIDGNKPPDFKALKRAGASFAWVRASFAYHDPGHKAWVLAPDPAFGRDWQRLGNSGLLRGAYMGPAVMASHQPEEQVAAFAASVRAAGGLIPGRDFPPCLDIEFPQGIAGTGLTRDQIMGWIRRAVGAMQGAFGCWPILYTSGRVWNDTDADCLGDPKAPDLAMCALWLARYAYPTRAPAVIPPPDGAAPPVPHPWGDEWHAHQDQGDALGCPGFTATVDIDRFRTAALGDKGGHVAWAQRKLLIQPDGDFGPQTEAAVKAFQQTTAHIAPDGVIGPETFAALAWR